jgi:hypothetical protein
VHSFSAVGLPPPRGCRGLQVRHADVTGNEARRMTHQNSVCCQGSNNSAASRMAWLRECWIKREWPDICRLDRQVAQPADTWPHRAVSTTRVTTCHQHTATYRDRCNMTGHSGWFPLTATHRHTRTTRTKLVCVCFLSSATSHLALLLYQRVFRPTRPSQYSPDILRAHAYTATVSPPQTASSALSL